MARRIAVNTLNASTIDILNVIRQNASYDYQQSVLEFSNKYHDGTNLVLDARNQRSGRHDNRSE